MTNSSTEAMLQEALSDAAQALGYDRGRRNESIADRIRAIRRERDRLLAENEVLRKWAPSQAIREIEAMPDF